MTRMRFSVLGMFWLQMLFCLLRAEQKTLVIWSLKTWLSPFDHTLLQPLILWKCIFCYLVRHPLITVATVQTCTTVGSQSQELRHIVIWALPVLLITQYCTTYCKGNLFCGCDSIKSPSTECSSNKSSRILALLAVLHLVTSPLSSFKVRFISHITKTNEILFGLKSAALCRKELKNRRNSVCSRKWSNLCSDQMQADLFLYFIFADCNLECFCTLCLLALKSKCLWPQRCLWLQTSTHINHTYVSKP